MLIICRRQRCAASWDLVYDSHWHACIALVLNLNLVGKDSEHSVDNVGTVPAALSTYLACQRFQPDLIISVGTAGGFQSQGAAIGDVFLGTSTVNHDRRIPIPV